MVKRLGFWLVVLVLELAATTLASGVAVAYMASFAAFGRLPDDPSPPPVTQKDLVLTLDWQKSAFAWTFWGLAGTLGLLNLACYFASLIRPGKLVTFSAIAGRRARATCVKFLLMMIFLFAWATAWSTWLMDVTVPRGAWVHGLSWLTVAAAFIAVAVALSFAVGLAVLRRTLGADVYLGGVVFAWLRLDSGIRAPSEAGNPA